ncbi:hypothetical protein SCUCBS95973_002370 [Sporothrix curviconia]|uniref:Peptidase S8/S53 domain-containing protein n=1 Tax=Sporothrix curviconia TaxID=1260050 RepID=A0ABP0B6C3_9PEZI
MDNLKRSSTRLAPEKPSKLAMAIDTWRRTSYSDNNAFQQALEPLYDSLVDETQKTLGKTDMEMKQKPILAFLGEESQHVDRCVRWHLLKLAIDKTKAQNARGTAKATATTPSKMTSLDTAASVAHVQLAKMIMASRPDGWAVFFCSPRSKRMKEFCNWGRDGKKSEQQLKEKPHMRKRVDGVVENTLFAAALCAGHPFMQELLAEARARCARQQQGTDADEVIASLVRSDSVDLFDDIAKYYRRSHLAFSHVLTEIPGILHSPADPLHKDNIGNVDTTFLDKETKFLDAVIEKPLQGLAKVILGSDHHREILTTHERLEMAIRLWMNEKRKNHKNSHDDSDSDSNDDDKKSVVEYDASKSTRRQLTIDLLAKAPKNVLLSHEVLTAVIKYGLFDDDQILQAYVQSTRGSNRGKDASGDNKASTVSVSGSPSSFQPIASILAGVHGVLHMAVFYQQQQLVEALLRHDARLAVSSAYIEVTTAGSTLFPERTVREASVKPALATIGANGVPGDENSGHFPLWYNNEANKAMASDARVSSLNGATGTQEQRNQTWMHIRSALIYCSMKHATSVQDLLRILHESGEHEINFDMSRLLIEGTSVADFVTSMPRHGRSSSLIRYEETIRYAEFPVLDVSTQPQNPATQNTQRAHLQLAHREIFDMLDWLADHGVRRIITLRVPDRMAHPHDELEIADVVRRFRVEELDWHILDLSLTIFQPYGRPEDIPLVWSEDKDKTRKASKPKVAKATYLRRLHLYTGGRRSALDHWFSKEGLEATKLDSVCIHLIKEITTKKQSEETLRFIYEKVEEIAERKPSLTIDVQSQFWMAQTETPRLQDIIHDLSPRLAQFIAYYRQKASDIHTKFKTFRPTKVAIIDNGILSMDPPGTTPTGAGPDRSEDDLDMYGRSDKLDGSIGTSASISAKHLQSPEFLMSDSLWARVCDGKSFVYEQDRVSPWYLASNPHGTQMANLLCAIDPLCQLFVAKIADSRYGYSAARAAEAVKWAIERDVDIISMSFTTTEKNTEFDKAVRAAMDKGILIVCSHHDEGARIGMEVYPACLSSIGGSNTLLRMASCNMYGRLLHEWDDSSADKGSKMDDLYDFCINSQDVTVGTIPFLAASTDRIGGSSVATAIAAGVCSLLIACLRTNHADSSKEQKDTVVVGRMRSQNMYGNVGRAPDNKNRPSYSSIKAYLKTMAPSETNKQFISLDRFAGLEALRDVNDTNLAAKFRSLAANFPAQS